MLVLGSIVSAVQLETMSCDLGECTDDFGSHSSFKAKLPLSESSLYEMMGTKKTAVNCDGCKSACASVLKH